MKLPFDSNRLVVVVSRCLQSKISIVFIGKFKSIYVYFLQDIVFLDNIKDQLQEEELVFYLDRFILVLPKEYKKRSCLWMAFYECFGIYYLDLIDPPHNLACINGMLTYIKEHMNISRTSVILDYGCGSGLSSKVEFLGKIIGYEPVEAMRRQALKNGLTAFSIRGIKNLPPNSFDAVFSSYVFHMDVDEDSICQIMKKMRADSLWIANYYKNMNVERINSIFNKRGFEIKKIQDFSERFGLTYEYKKRTDNVPVG